MKTEGKMSDLHLEKSTYNMVGGGTIGEWDIWRGEEVIFSTTDQLQAERMLDAMKKDREMKTDTELLAWVLSHCIVIYDSLEVDNRELLAELVEEMEQEQLDAYRENEPHEYE